MSVAAVLLALGISATQAVAASADSGAPAAVAADPPAEPQPQPEPAQPEFTETQLSDELLLSRWAFVTRKVTAYSEPKNGGRRVRKLTTRTPDHTHELVLALKERVYTDDGSIWVQVRLPMRGSGRTGWLRRGYLSGYNTVTTRLEVSRNRRTATLFKAGKKIWQARIGIGKKGTVTPAGDFYIRNKLIVSNPGGPYGPYAMGLSAYSKTLSDWPGGGVIGIHGTNQPGLIPGRISHGCIRVKNKKIRRLYRLMPAGTPVKIF